MQKLFFLFSLFLIITTAKTHVYAQSPEPTRMFRIFEDNDFLNITGNGTDAAYTNGTRFDLFFSKKHSSRFFLDRILPKAGRKAVNTFGYGFMQMMFTPKDIGETYYQDDDYPYAGALFATHTLFSYNPEKTYSFQTELLAGIRGPSSFAKETQIFIHKLIDNQRPMGWDNQLKTIPLFNINFTVEKQLWHYRNFLEVIGGANLAAGSMIDAAGIYPLIRIGKMNPYFKGFFSQFSTDPKANRKRTQIYAIVKAKTTFVLHNALLRGERLEAPPTQDINNDFNNRTIRHRLTEIVYGAVFAHGNFSFTYTQNPTTEYNQGLYHHNVGNITFSLNW